MGYIGVLWGPTKLQFLPYNNFPSFLSKSSQRKKNIKTKNKSSNNNKAQEEVYVVFYCLV